MRKISVRNSERMAEAFPSFSAVKKPEANRLKPISRNAAAKIYVPRTAISVTGAEFSAKRRSMGRAKGKAIAKVSSDIPATVLSAARVSRFSSEKFSAPK